MVASIRWDAWARCCSRAHVHIQLATLRLGPPRWSVVVRRRLAGLWTDPIPAPVRPPARPSSRPAVHAPVPPSPAPVAISAPIGAPPWAGERRVQAEA